MGLDISTLPFFCEFGLAISRPIFTQA